MDPSKFPQFNSKYRVDLSYPYIFKPEVDNFTSDPFVPKNPWEMIEAGEFNHIPIIMGSNSEEGLLSALEIYKNEARIKELAAKWENFYGPLVILNRLDKR
jgi:carboxylesterase type B